MANNKRERAEHEYFDGAEETEQNYRRFNDWRAGYAAATAEGIPQADGWVATETVDDLPKVGGRYLWQFRNVDDGIEFDLRIFKPSMDGQDFVKVFMAWKRPAPYQRQSSEGGGCG